MIATNYKILFAGLYINFSAFEISVHDILETKKNRFPSPKIILAESSPITQERHIRKPRKVKGIHISMEENFEKFQVSNYEISKPAFPSATQVKTSKY